MAIFTASFDVNQLEACLADTDALFASIASAEATAR